MVDIERRVVYIRHTSSDGVLRIGISDADRTTVSHTVSVRRYPSAASFAVGDTIDGETYGDILRAEEEYKARRRALSLLALSDNNEKTLKMKLVSKGISRDIAEDVCRQMVELGYIDERRQLERLILADANTKFYGPKKIFARLMAKGYASSDIRAVTEILISRGEIDFEQRARELIRTSYPDGADDEDKKRLLYKHGYKIC